MPHLGDGSMESIVSDSIRCGLWNGGYRGSDQGESGVQGQVSRFQSFRVSEFQSFRELRAGLDAFQVRVKGKKMRG
jgi:hypothetical protein